MNQSSLKQCKRDNYGVAVTPPFLRAIVSRRKVRSIAYSSSLLESTEFSAILTQSDVVRNAR